MRFNYNFIYRRMPKKYRKWTSDYARYSNITLSEEIYFGFIILYGLVLMLCVYFVISLLVTIKTSLFIAFSVFIVFETFMHYILVMIADSRASFTEEILPDALRLISSNLRSGLTPDKALMLSARPEFGPLEIGIRQAAKKSLSGQSIEEVLKAIPENINSKPLRRSIDLISEGMTRGGNLTRLLDGLADDIRQAMILRKEVAAQVMMYAIFIFFAVGFAAPVLYSVSSYLVQTMSELGKAVNIEQTVSTQFIRFSLKGLDVEPQFLMTYSLACLTVTCIFAGLLVGLIRRGSERFGVKYIPMLLIISIGVYFLSRTIVMNILSKVIV